MGSEELDNWVIENQNPRPNLGYQGRSLGSLGSSNVSCPRIRTGKWFMHFRFFLAINSFRRVPKISIRCLMAKSREPGFSVIELVIVVAVIMAIVAIAIPRVRSAQISVNTAAAVASMRAIHTAEATYAANFPSVGYSSTLLDLGPNGSDCESTTSTNACLIDGALATGVRSGYVFELSADPAVPVMAYSLTGSPVSIGFSGACAFASDQSGSIQAKTNTNASGLQMGDGSGSCM